MSIKLQLRRGLETDLPSLAIGEPGFCTNSYKMFIGSAAGNKGIAMLASPIFTGTVTIPVTTSSTVGVIYKGTNRFIHDFAHATATGLNTFVGVNAGNFTMSPGGGDAGLASRNTGVGNNSLSALTTGYYNTAVGANTLSQIDVAYRNSAFGWGALYAAHGAESIGNTAVGMQAIYFNYTGYENTAVGNLALYSTAGGSGYENTAVGAEALYAMDSGHSNTGIGHRAGMALTTGHRNIMIGWGAGWGVEDAFGSVNKPVADDHGILIGHLADRSVVSATILTNYIGIGYGVLIDKSNQTKIGNTSITECFLYGTPHFILASIAAYANDAAAQAGGLAVGDVYRTNADPSVLCIRSA